MATLEPQLKEGRLRVEVAIRPTVRIAEILGCCYLDRSVLSLTLEHIGIAFFPE